MSLSQFDIIKSLGESIAWFEKELSWGMPVAELRHLTGRIGELYVAMMTLGQLAESVNQKGYDVVSCTGQRISVKTITTASHVDFNIKTLELVDRVIVLKINPKDLCIEIVYDLNIDEFKDKIREYDGKYTLGISKKINLNNSKLDIGLNIPIEEKLEESEEVIESKSLIINSINYNEYEIKQYENGSVIVYKDDKKVRSSIGVLKDIALAMNVPLENAARNPKNTQQLGDHVIKAIKNYRAT